MKAIITVGISASGKTTWAKEYAKTHKAIISNRDDMRFSLTGAKDWSEYKFDKKIETLITNQQYNLAYNASKIGKDFIQSDTNLNPTFREALVTNLRDLGYDVEIKPFPVTLEEAWKRDGLRANGVGRDVIYKQYKQWLKFIGRKTYEPDTSLPDAVIFDIDGTVAHMSGRGPYEWNKVGGDVPDFHVACMVHDYYQRGFKIIFASGRDGSCERETVEWIDRVLHLDSYSLFMREKGDQRKDTVVKEEIFWKYVAPRYDVKLVVDDRPVVCRMWREIGIPKVIQVGDPHEEF